MILISVLLIGMMSFAQTIQVTNAKTNQNHEVSVFDFTYWATNNTGKLAARVPGINNNKVFYCKEDFAPMNQQRIELMKYNPDGSIIISNKFKYSAANLFANNEFIIDLWADSGTHTISLPPGIEFVSSAIEDYQWMNTKSNRVKIFDLTRTQVDNIITLEFTTTPHFRRDDQWNNDWKMWRGPDWYWGGHSMTIDQYSGKRYVGNMVLKFTSTGTFIVPEFQGGVFFVESLKTPVEPVSTVVSTAATIVSWQTPSPTWATNKADLITQMQHPVNQSITGLDVNGKYVHKESIVNGASTTNYPFKVTWRITDVDPTKINQPQHIFGDVQDFDPNGLVLKPVWEVWILSEAPTVFPFPDGVFQTKEAPSSNLININTASIEELQKISGVGAVLAKRIFDARPFKNAKDLQRVSGIGAKTAEDIGKQVKFE